MHLKFQASGRGNAQGVDGGGAWREPAAAVEDPSERVAHHPSVLGGETVRGERHHHIDGLRHAKGAFGSGVVGTSLVRLAIDFGQQHREVCPALGGRHRRQGQVQAVSGGDESIPEGVQRGASKVAVMQGKLVYRLRSEVVDRQNGVHHRIAMGAARRQQPTEGGIEARRVRQVQRVQSAAVGGGDQSARRGVQHEVRYNHIGQPFRQPVPLGGTTGELVNAHIRSGVGIARTRHVNGEGIHRSRRKAIRHGGPGVAAVGGVEDLVGVRIARDADPDFVGVGGIHGDVRDVGEPIGHIQQAEVLPVGAPVEAVFLGHIEPADIAGRQGKGRARPTGNEPQWRPVFSAVRGLVNPVLGHIHPVRVEIADRPGGQPGTSAILIRAGVACNLLEGVAAIVGSKQLPVIQRGIDHVGQGRVKGAVEPVSAQDMFPLSVVLQKSAVVLRAGNEPVHGEGVGIDPVSLGNGQPVAVVFREGSVRVKQERTAIIGHQERAVGPEFEAVLVGMHIGEVASGVPVSRTTPGLTGIGGFPEVHAAHENAVGLGGMHGQTQIIPSLPTHVGAPNRPAEQVGAFAFEQLWTPALPPVETAPQAGKPLVGNLAGQRVHRLGIGRGKGQRDSTQAVAFSVEKSRAPRCPCVVAFGHRVSEGTGQHVGRVRRVDFE